ncbi:MAG: glutamate racemase [Candidatus Pacebacteria bacterium]|nr:glutamate racemase [Candidatus Paceibacterota bacterium]MDR3582991.1 glutamate racemase [Candidatus Paceibacterota bacterium]
MQRKKFIGIFDSGFGGLDIMRGITKALPDYDFIYLGDTARVPYGTRSKETIYQFTKEAVDFLFGKNCELVIFACNTASSDALRLIQKKHVPENHKNKKVLGVLIPAAEVAYEVSKNKKIGVMATASTVASKSFARELKKIDPEIKIYQQACPLLVPLVEAGEQNSEITETALRKYLKPLLAKKIDTLILGCTHYGILERKIKKIAGKEMKIVSESKIIGRKLKDYLVRHPEIEKKIAKNKRRTFYSTDLTDNFQKLGSKFFGAKIEVKKASLK